MNPLMTLPSNVRSLVALGLFSFLGGAWLTLATEARTRAFRREAKAELAASPVVDRGATGMQPTDTAKGARRSASPAVERARPFLCDGPHAREGTSLGVQGTRLTLEE